MDVDAFFVVVLLGAFLQVLLIRAIFGGKKSSKLGSAHHLITRGRRSVMDYSGPAPKDAVRRALDAAIHAPNHWTNYPWRYARRNAICGLQSIPRRRVCARGLSLNLCLVCPLHPLPPPRPPHPPHFHTSSTLPRRLDRSLCSPTYSILKAHHTMATMATMPYARAYRSGHHSSLSPAKAVV